MRIQFRVSVRAFVHVRARARARACGGGESTG